MDRDGASLERQFERLAAARIQLIPADVPRHFLFERDGYVALVERTSAGFGRIGNAGLLSPKGLAPLLWRGDSAHFVAKGFDQDATPEQVRAVREFSADLENCLRST